MEARALLDALTIAERLKDTTRHCYTSRGRRESVAEHCWMMTLMAFFMREEFPDADMESAPTYFYEINKEPPRNAAALSCVCRLDYLTRSAVSFAIISSSLVGTTQT